MEKKNQSLPKGYTGAVDRLGQFYPFERAEVINASHSRKFRELTLNILRTAPRIHFEKVKGQLEHPEYYAVNYQDYDYKALAIDFLGFCVFSIYGNKLGGYAAIEVPDPEIYGYSITKEQQETLCHLVMINHCHIDSLKPIFQMEPYTTKMNQYEKIRK